MTQRKRPKAVRWRDVAPALRAQAIGALKYERAIAKRWGLKETVRAFDAAIAELRV